MADFREEQITTSPHITVVQVFNSDGAPYTTVKATLALRWPQEMVISFEVGGADYSTPEACFAVLRDQIDAYLRDVERQVAFTLNEMDAYLEQASHSQEIEEDE